MCFSAEASFIVGGSLLVVGAAIIKRIDAKKDIPVALVPFIFAAQQIVEGLLWLSIDSGNPQAQFWLSNSYGVFVGVIWPLYVPFAIYFAETDNTRKKIIAFIGISGLLLALYTVIGIARQPITAEIINDNIYYEHDVHIYPLVIVLYLISTCLPFILSSFKNLHLAGFVIMIGFCIAILIYAKTFVSVWCFFAAIASTLIFLYFKNRIQKPLIPVP
ncbi:MAG: hypothetical protein H6937_01140 [Burkholderiales bacterium]|nr:hypothetical protein [Burkholderiales bacterium]MDR4518253.1 hypothetical protein [Nitrosomonas sp.]